MPPERITLPDDWEETRFERGSYGPDERGGFEATAENGTAALSVVPVRYRAENGHQHVRSLVGDYEADHEDPTGHVPDLGPTTGFALRATFTPYEVEQSAVLTVAADAGDALAAAAWLAAESRDDRELVRNGRLHAGTQPPSRTAPPLSDDDVLAALFADEPTRCLLTGKETTSHEVTVPYRYVPLLDGAKRTGRGVVRFPSTVGALRGVVSHGAWEDEGLDDVTLDAPLERVDAGEYRLDPDAASMLSGVDAGRFALARLGDV